MRIEKFTLFEICDARPYYWWVELFSFEFENGFSRSLFFYSNMDGDISTEVFFVRFIGKVEEE